MKKIFLVINTSAHFLKDAICDAFSSRKKAEDFIKLFPNSESEILDITLDPDINKYKGKKFYFIRISDSGYIDKIVEQELTLDNYKKVDVYAHDGLNIFIIADNRKEAISKATETWNKWKEIKEIAH